MGARARASRVRAGVADRLRLAGLAARGRADPGRCAACGRPTLFVAEDDWLRDFWFCVRCRSIPRQRALMLVLGHVFPGWRDQRIHEFAPSGPGSARLAREAPGYTASQYWPDVPPGAMRDGVRCEDIEGTTFADASLDLVVTQDVFEHVLDPGAAFAELARILRPGGAHVFTVPYYGARATRVRARRGPGGTVEHLAPPDFHGNPVDPDGSLVVTEWGPELLDTIASHGGMRTTVYDVRDRRRGVDGAFREVFVSAR